MQEDACNLTHEEAAEVGQSQTKSCLCHVTFGRLINLSDILFSLVQNGDHSNAYVCGGREEIMRMAGVKQW